MQAPHSLTPRPGMQQDASKNPSAPSSQAVQMSQDHADQVLQQQLLAAQYDPSQAVPHPPRPQPTHLQGQRDPGASNIDPAISGAPGPSGMVPAPTDITGPDDSPQHQPQPHNQTQEQQQQAQEARKVYGKRELSSSKRAAQNRAAQRAFRQRKESYIRKLEEQVKDSETLKAVQAENYQLREYIIALQSRLIASQNEVPELPPNIDLSQFRPDPTATQTTQQHQAPPPPPQPQPGTMGEQPEQLNALNRIAVAGLGMRKHQHEEAAYLGANNNNNGGSPVNKRARTDGVDESMGGGAGDQSSSKVETSSSPAS